MLVKQRLFNQFFSRWFKPFDADRKDVGDTLSHITDDASMRFSKAQLLCLITVVMLILAFGINLFEGNRVLVLVLGIMLLVSIMLFVFLLLTRNDAFVRLTISLLLMGLGVFLLCVWSIPDGSSLFWFLLLPPMLMFCVGLRTGTILFFIFYLFLLILFLTPLDILLANNFSWPMRLRFLGATIGIFIFSWLAEFGRSNAQQALLQTAIMMEHNALTDPLTSLGNRRDFQNYFAVNHAQLQRSNRMFSIAMVDLDYFKRVNDTFGHAVGDMVLCHVASILSTYLRASDRIFRWGGEEFIILMPETTAMEARIIAERLRHEIENSPFTTEKGRIIHITISIGLHSGSLEANIENHLASADEKLYLAKHSGRNQVQG